MGQILKGTLCYNNNIPVVELSSRPQVSGFQHLNRIELLTFSSMQQHKAGDRESSHPCMILR